ncbi:esterase family protein [Paenibacillus doosanensis]|uniref:Endo-1,4-beta-xylanase/feruloyl esterase n=1 Tax=Paenibacillus konkukensis TaxID=2020716 RepID=A0ABY4RJ55_9BACL|nr:MULTISPECIES: alpha/beta hydrolase family protein [Paenibacillus]MCS7461087.1 esterase family protein [Paenibacillus doosanensis]UQZ81583.1 Endo-1,4-beta-xylanase/feruloyl esterase precursor [Paenibacillus konkukensis]
MTVRPHPFFSGALYARKLCFVYLPDGYEREERDYPVIYLLHGMFGSEAHWLLKGNAEQTLDRMMAAGSLRRCIVVMPSDGGYGTGTFYMNWYDGSGRFEDYFIYDLVEDIDKQFRTRKEPGGRAVCGLSMGGFGAFSLALRHPQLFGAAASLSGALTSTAAIAARYARSDISRMIGPLHGPYAGEYDLQALASRRLKEEGRPALYFNCGTGDELHGMNAAYREHLESIGYSHKYEEYSGEHTWDYWSEHLPDALGFLESYFASCD